MTVVANCPVEHCRHSLYRVSYTDTNNLPGYWDFWAKDQQHAWQQAHELLPRFYKVTNVYLKEEW